MIVVDASVAAKWLLPEDGSDAARDLLAGTDALFVPEVAMVEVPGAVLRKMRAGLLDESEVRQCLALWSDLLRDLVRVIPTSMLLGDAIDIAISVLHPLIDCLYVAAAVQLGAGLVTADVTLHSKCRRAHEDIVLLGARIST